MSTFKDRISDKDYNNWLKACLCLAHVKEGLLEFANKECTALQNRILSDASIGEKVCNICTGNAIRWDNKAEQWIISCPNNVCNRLASEIQKHHVLPKPKKMSWSNCHIQSWPTCPWEVAKVFTNPNHDAFKKKAPEDADCSSLLNLFEQCKWFDRKISMPLCFKVRDHRNKLMHSPDLKIPNVSLKAWLSDMIALLKSLVSYSRMPGAEKAVLDIEQIRETDIAITEVEEKEVLSEKIRALEGRVTMVTQTMSHLKEGFGSLENELQNFESNITINVEAFQVRCKKDIQEELLQVKGLHQEQIVEFQEEDFSSWKQFVANNNTELKEDFRIAIAAVTDRLTRLREEFHDFDLPDLTRRVKKNSQSISMLSESLAAAKKEREDLQKGTQTNETDTAYKYNQAYYLSRVKEKQSTKVVAERAKKVKYFFTAKKKRPFKRRSLRTIKSLSKDFMQSKLKTKFVETRQYLQARSMLMENGSLVISGNPGEGKTMMSVALMKSLASIDKCIKLTKAHDFESLVLESVECILVDDMFGIYQCDNGKINDWFSLFDDLQALVEEKKVKLIMTTRKRVLAECEQYLQRHDIFRPKIELSSNVLSKDEKKQILNNIQNSRDPHCLSDSKIEECCANFDFGIGFPFCCHLFLREPSLLQEGAKFFNKPYEFLARDIQSLDKRSLVALICLFYYEGQLEHNMLVGSDKKALKLTIAKISESLCLSNENPSVADVHDSLKKFTGVYVENTTNSYNYSHNLVYETIALVYWQNNPVDVIKQCSLDFLCQSLDTAAGSDRGTIQVSSRPCLEVLADRLIGEVKVKNQIVTIAQHPVFLDESFVNCFIGILNRDNGRYNRDNAFLHAVLRKTNCLTHREEKLFFFPELLRSKSSGISNIIEKLLSTFLSCNHKNGESVNINECWQCEQKQIALDNACLRKEDTLAKLLIQHGAIPSVRGIINSCKHKNFSLLITLMEALEMVVDLDTDGIYNKTSKSAPNSAGENNVVNTSAEVDKVLDLKVLKFK